MEISLGRTTATLARCRLPSSACRAGEPCRPVDARGVFADADRRVSGFLPTVETDQRKAAGAVSCQELTEHHAAGTHRASGRWQIGAIESSNRQQSLAGGAAVLH